MKIVLPEKVKFIIETLETHGYESYAVGGCVRDTMLHRTPGDWDITTQAKPEHAPVFPTRPARHQLFSASPTELPPRLFHHR